MKWIALVLLVLLAAAGVAITLQDRALSALESEKEHAALEAATAKRKALEADTKGRQEIMRWKAAAARHQAEVKRLRTAASAAATEVKAVVKAGETLVASGTTDEILGALRARGYHPARCLTVGK